jgi:tape measure domain-containing protein
MAQDIKVALTLDNKQFNSALKDSQKKTKQFSSTATKEVGGLTTAFKGLFAAIGVREIINLGDEFTVLNNRLKAVTNSEQEAAAALEIVKQVASETRSDLAAVASLFSDITLATEEMGLTQQQVAQVATTFSQALKVSGADAGAAAGAIRQFGQALASGVLRGDEFNSINEANSKFMGEFAKALGVTRGELRDMAKEGVLTSEVILQATQRMASSVEADFGKTTTTIGESFTALKASFLALFGAIGEETGVFDGLAGAVASLAKSIDALAANTEGLQTLLKVLAGIGVAIGAFAGLRAVTAIMNGLQKAFTVLSTKGVGVSRAVQGIKASFGALIGRSGKITEAVGKNGNAFTRLGQILFSISGIFASFARILLRFIGPAGAFFAIATAIDFVVEKFTGFSIVDWVTDKFKKLWGWLRKTLVQLGLMDELQEEVAGSIEDTTSSIEDQTKTLEDNESSVISTAKALQTYEEFLKELLDDSAEAVRILGFQTQAQEDLRKMYDAGTISLEQYREALDAINKSMIDVSERLEGATDAVNDFNDEIMSGTNDLQKELDQLNMTEFERSQDDIRRNLEELRDETLRDLQDELKGLDPVIDQVAIEQIKAQMQQVKDATQEAIETQQGLGEAAYNASRTFEHGWDEALRSFIEDTTDEAAKAKNIFETFTKGVEDAFVNFAKTGKLSFKDLLDSMVEMLIRSQVQKLMGSLLGAMGGAGGTGGGIGGFFKSIFGLAKGGPASGGRPYIVGEEGPELFVPKTSGTVVPNGAMGGQTVNNNTYITNAVSAVDAKSVAQLFAENRKTLLGTVQMAQNEMPYG